MQLLKKFIFFGCLAFLFTCTTSEKKQADNYFVTKNVNGYSISGISYAKADSIYVLDIDLKVINKAKISNKNIFLKGKVNTPKIVFLKLNTQKELYPIVLENEPFSVLFSKGKSTIVGGILHQKLSDYKSVIIKNALAKSNFHNQFYAKDISLNRFLNATQIALEK